MAIEGSIARRYARALLEIGVQQQNFEKIAEELHSLSRLFAQSADLSRALSSPVFGAAQRRSLLLAVSDRLNLSVPVRHLLLLLLDRGRLEQLGDIAREMQTLVDRQVGRVRATVVSAVPLSEEFASTLRRALETRMGKRVILEQQQDASLMGGLVAKVGDIVYDNSIRTQLELAQEQLLAK